MGHKDWHTTMQYYEYVEKTPDPDAAATVSQAIWGIITAYLSQCVPSPGGGTLFTPGGTLF